MSSTYQTYFSNFGRSLTCHTVRMPPPRSGQMACQASPKSSNYMLHKYLHVVDIHIGGGRSKRESVSFHVVHAVCMSSQLGGNSVVGRFPFSLFAAGGFPFFPCSPRSIRFYRSVCTFLSNIDPPPSERVFCPTMEDAAPWTPLECLDNVLL